MPTPAGSELLEAMSLSPEKSVELLSEAVGEREELTSQEVSEPSVQVISIPSFHSGSLQLHDCEQCPCVNDTMYCSARRMKSFLLKKMHEDITYLELSHNQLEQLPAYVFSMMPNLREASLSDNYISTMDSKAFEGNKHLILLDLSSNAIVNIPADTFTKHSNLQRIYLLRNRINDIAFTAQIRNCSLQTFQISTNYLTRLVKKTFGRCDGLKELWIDGNKISEIHEDAFEGLFHLTILDLSDNRIMEIREKTFSSLKSLRVLDLSRNRLTTIEGGTFLVLSSLENLNLSYNWLCQIITRTFSSCTSLRRLDLSENLIERIDPYAFSTLSSNSRLVITKPLHAECPNISNTSPNIPLEYLDLSHNHLRYVPVSSMLAFPSLEQLNLESNLFTAVGTDFVCLAASLNHRLRFSGNRLVCTCQALYQAFRLAEKIAPDFQPECLHTEEPWVVIRGRKCVLPPAVAQNRLSADFPPNPDSEEDQMTDEEELPDESQAVNVRASVLGAILGLAFVVSMAAFAAEVVKYYRRAKYDVPGPEEVRMTQYARRGSARSAVLPRPGAVLQEIAAVEDVRKQLTNGGDEMSKL